MSRIKEVVDIVDFYDRSGSDPFILRRAVGRNQNRVIIIFIAYKISGRRQKNTVTIGVAAFFQVINIIYAVFIGLQLIRQPPQLLQNLMKGKTEPADRCIQTAAFSSESSFWDKICRNWRF